MEHTPKPLPTGYNGNPFIVGQGDCLECAISGCVVIFLESWYSSKHLWEKGRGSESDIRSTLVNLSSATIDLEEEVNNFMLQLVSEYLDPHLPVPYIFGTRGRSLFDILVCLRVKRFQIYI